MSEQKERLYYGTDPVLNWKVLLIGGCSGVGKTRVSSLIARYFNASLNQVDDFRMALQSVTNPAQQPQLHFFITSPGVAKEGIWQMSPEVLCDAIIKVGEVVSRALDVVIAHHVIIGRPIVLEGDGILPTLAARRILDGLDVGKQVRAVFLHESEEEFFFRKVRQHEFKFENKQQMEEWTQMQMHWLYGQWLVKEAERLHLPIIPSRPWGTLADRILAAIG